MQEGRWQHIGTYLAYTAIFVNRAVSQEGKSFKPTSTHAAAFEKPRDANCGLEKDGPVACMTMSGQTDKVGDPVKPR